MRFPIPPRRLARSRSRRVVRRGPEGLVRPRVVGVVAWTLLLPLAACRDSPTDPLEGLVAAETDQAALALELPLPTPVRDRDDRSPHEGVLRWMASWDRPILEGRRIRSALYPELGAYLAGEGTGDELVQELALLRLGIRRAGQLDAGALPEFLTAGVDRARDAYRRGDRAARAGHEKEGWTELIRGADALREVGPEAVARSAVARAEARLRRIQGAGSYSETERERIGHLVRGGRQALDAGAWGLAIRRAFYARGLIDGNG